MALPSTIADRWDFRRSILELVVNRRGDWVAARMNDGSMLLLPACETIDEPLEIQVHNGVSLSLQPDADENAFLSGGSDGKLFIVDPGVSVPTQLATHEGQRIENVASSPDGFRAYTVGEQVYLLDIDGEESGPERLVPGLAKGMAFAPDGRRLAVGCEGGVCLCNESFTRLHCEGNCLKVFWNSGGEKIAALTQENFLQVWRLADKESLRFAGTVKDARYMRQSDCLVTAGSTQIFCWPLGDEGPWGKKPVVLGASGNRVVTCVAPHPADAFVAAGYDDGMVVLAPLDGRLEIVVHQPVGVSVTGLAWNSEGDCLFAALESGTVLLFTRKSISHGVK